MATRIGHLCWYRQTPAGQWRRGTLYDWGADFECCEGDVTLPFPIGVVEDFDTKRCHSVRVNRICFARDSPDKTDVE